jgi:hypothetical protein
MTIKEIDNAITDEFNDHCWEPLINFFWERYNKRYFNPIKCLQTHENFDIRNNCGFIIATIDCILIETLEQYYGGSDESKGKNHEPFLSFFQRSKAFKGIISDPADAGKFAGLIRSGLLHQSKTKKASIINKQGSTPILDWIDSNNKNKGFKINRDKFHKAVFAEYENLIENLKKKENIALRGKFKTKLKTLLE